MTMDIPPSRITALETGTGIAWNDWIAFFEPHRDLDHTALAALALDRILTQGRSRSPEWWAQGVTVAFEQHIGRRGVGERCDGSYSATVSRTLPGTMDEVLARMAASGDGREDFVGVPVESSPTTSATEKWRYWRVRLADGSKVSINIQTKPAGDKATVAVNHDGLDDPARVPQVKQWWKDWLTQF